MKLSTEMQGVVWALEDVARQSIERKLAQAELSLAGEQMEAAAKAAVAGSQGGAAPTYQVRGKTALIPISGLIMKGDAPWYLSFFGIQATGTNQIRANLEAALADDAVERIVMLIDSPGGMVAGTQELADYIFASRGKKPLVAQVQDTCASGAYWLASQCERIGANQTAMVGSIGVYVAFYDDERAAKNAGIEPHIIRDGDLKAMGQAGIRISEEQIAAVKSAVQGIGVSFRAAVARGRNLDPKQVSTVSTGRYWVAEEARGLGLIDRVENLDAALAGDMPEDPTGSVEETNMAEKKPVGSAEVQPKAETLIPSATATAPAASAGQEAAAPKQEVTVVRPVETPDPVATERARAAEITELCANAGLPTMAAGLIKEGLSADAAARRVLSEASKDGKLGGKAALNDPAKLPKEPEDGAQAADRKLKADYDAQPKAIRAAVTFEQFKASEGK